VQRRTFMLSTGAALLAATAQITTLDGAAGSPAHTTRPARGSQPVAAARSSLVAIENQLGGRVGVAALDVGSGVWLKYRADERFAMCSTFKWMLAAAVLSQADQDAALLDRLIHYGPMDLLDVAPVTSAHISEGALSIRALCEAAVEVSDNTAANLLLKFIGGPKALTAYLRRTGDRVTRLDRNEPTLNTNLANDPRDTTTPAAMVATLQRLLLGNALSTSSRELLLDWLKKCQTGTHRIRAGLPQDWPVGDKTGTGANSAANDNAIAFPPGRAPVLIATYLSGSGASADALNDAHARIGGVVAAAFGTAPP
jgi:beta-lactamase class A